MHDQYHDPGHGRLAQLFLRFPKLAEYVKEAEIEDSPADLPRGAFACPEQRRYPLHTPAQAAVSYAYAKTASVSGSILRELETALEAYGLPAELYAEAEVKVASLEAEDCLFPETKTYPVRDADEVRTAESRLHAQLYKLAAETRAEAFDRLASAADLHGVKLNPSSYKLAGRTQTDPEALREQLLIRAGAVEPKLASRYETLAKFVRTDRRALRDPENQAKLASAILELDREAGLERKYDRGVLDPLQTVYNTTKVAASGVDLDGQSYSLAGLAGLDPSFYGDALGDDIIPQIATRGSVDATKLAEVLQTLPADMQRQLGQLLASAGVR
jgi:hypothetical protein